jgi:O-methyltransferase
MSIKSIASRILPKRIKGAIKVFLNPDLLKLDADSKYPNFPYFYDGLATMHRYDFMNDRKFMEAFNEADKFLLGPKMYWRTYVICWAANKGISIEGDFVECGVFKGGFAKAVTKYTQFENLNKNYYLFDTYRGLAKEYASDKEKEREYEFHRYEEDYFEEAKQNFIAYTNVSLIKGTVPDTLNSVSIPKVAFLSLDMNSAVPEEQALKYFWEKLSSGAVVVFDDYGFNGYEEQKIIHDKFAKEKNLEILLLPTGQGLLFKP